MPSLSGYVASKPRHACRRAIGGLAAIHPPRVLRAVPPAWRRRLAYQANRV